jgi:hypothetical protein
MLKALAAAEKVARYRHAQLSAVRLAGDINATITDDASKATELPCGNEMTHGPFASFFAAPRTRIIRSPRRREQAAQVEW